MGFKRSLTGPALLFWKSRSEKTVSNDHELLSSGILRIREPIQMIHSFTVRNAANP